MTFATWTYRIAAIYGFAITTPLLFMESRMRPAVSHPEQYYGFLGLILVWQMAFWLISTDPVRYRPLMVVTWFEKACFFVACVVLFALGRIKGDVLAVGLIDGVLGVLFVVAYFKTPRVREEIA
jgi:hypothetical protein